MIKWNFHNREIRKEKTNVAIYVTEKRILLKGPRAK
jgi:hypothetical protein